MSSSVFDRKVQQEKQSGQGNYNQYGRQSWSEPVKLMFHESKILDFRDFDRREDADGNLIPLRDDPDHEVLCFAVTKPKSGGSVRQALSDKRAWPILSNLPTDWVAGANKARFWEKIITTDLTNSQMTIIAQRLGAVYLELGIKPQSVYEFIDAEQASLRSQRLAKQTPNTRAALNQQLHQNAQHFNMDRDDDVNPFLEAFKVVRESAPNRGPIAEDEGTRKKRNLQIRLGERTVESAPASARGDATAGGTVDAENPEHENSRADVEMVAPADNTNPGTN